MFLTRLRVNGYSVEGPVEGEAIDCRVSMSAGVTTLLGEVLQPFEHLGCGKARMIARESNMYHEQIPRRGQGPFLRRKHAV